MGKTDAMQGSMDLLVMKTLQRKGKLHGYAIMSAIRERSGDVLRVEEGSLYPALHVWKKPGGSAPSGSPKTPAAARACTN